MILGSTLVWSFNYRNSCVKIAISNTNSADSNQKFIVCPLIIKLFQNLSSLSEKTRGDNSFGTNDTTDISASHWILCGDHGFIFLTVKVLIRLGRCPGLPKSSLEGTGHLIGFIMQLFISGLHYVLNLHQAISMNLFF